MMQEIAESPLMLISLILWHYRVCGDREYLAKNYPGSIWRVTLISQPAMRHDEVFTIERN